MGTLCYRHLTPNGVKSELKLRRDEETVCGWSGGVRLIIIATVSLFYFRSDERQRAAAL